MVVASVATGVAGTAVVVATVVGAGAVAVAGVVIGTSDVSRAPSFVALHAVSASTTIRNLQYDHLPARFATIGSLLITTVRAPTR